MSDWTEKYRPTTKSEVRGNDEARDALWEWAETWGDHREAVVLHGSPGVGKTSAAHALAADRGWETVELNASDQRTGDVIERFAGRASKNATLAGSAGAAGDGGRQLVVMDEADNIHYQYDRGGKQAVTQLVKDANQPIVLIANEYYDMSRGLRKATRDIEFRDVSARSIVPVLRNICRQEGVAFDEEALKAIADADSGDLRSAIKDLQATVESGGGTDERIEVEDVVTGDRDRTVGIWTFLDAVLKEESPEEALRTAYDTDETPDDLTAWIEDKVSMVYDDDELADAYEFLANADRWLGRVRATQNYSYWRYVTDNLAAGVAAARRGTKGGWTQYGGPPYRSTRDGTRDYVVRKLAEAGGFSMATARREVLPFLAAATHHCKPRDLTAAMAAYYEFDESHVSFVTGSGETTNKVQSIVEDAEAIREEAMEEHSGSAFASGAQADGDDGAEEGDSDTGADADASGDGQTTLDGDDGGSADEASDDADAQSDDSDRDDGQSGLTDFV